MDPVIWFFLLGVLAGLMRSDLRMPKAVYELLSMVLLLTIGLKGGVELAQQPVGGLVVQVLAVASIGLVIPLAVFSAIRALSSAPRADAASLAAHYGSVSVATYAVGVSFLATRNVPVDAQLPLFLVVLEVPAIMVGIVLAKGAAARSNWGGVMHEVFLGKSIVLLIGGLLIGWLSGPEGIAPLEPLFFDLFKGVLALFLLEMGLIAANQASGLKRRATLVILTAILTPVPAAMLGIGVGHVIGLNVGGMTLLGVLAGSASYIAAPAAMRIAVPDANPSLSLSASLGITFPFNIFIGVPLYYGAAQWLAGAGA
ncbi:MAG: sodium-dependent bicarbonate transport family permease [Pseudomonadota bacterium]